MAMKNDKSFSNTRSWVNQMAQYLQEEIRNQGIEKYKIDDKDVSTIFLAWAPGAWKTEFIESSAIARKDKYVILDIDQYRCLFAGYKWNNAKDFHQCATWVIVKMYSFCMKNWLNVILDGTFSSHKYAKENIELCIKYKRTYAVVLIYQDPLLSYLYTRKRELEKTRNVPEEQFIKKFFWSIEICKQILIDYPETTLFLGLKTISSKKYITKQMSSAESIDLTIKYKYTEEELRVRIKEINNQTLWAIKRFLWNLLKNN